MIIGICGLIGSGKGTVADILVETYKFKKMSFADALKDGVAAMFDWPRHLLEGDTEESRNWREVEDLFWTKELGKPISPRIVLQVVGTEAMRIGFADDIWMLIVKKKLLAAQEENWVIPDTRFPNEIGMIQSIGGEVWHVKRGNVPEWYAGLTGFKAEHTLHTPWDVGNFMKSSFPSIHASEYSWHGTRFDQTIENDSTLDVLKHKIKNLVLDPHV